MTGLLLLSVQSVFKNLSKIRRKVFHARKGALNTLNDVGKPLFLRSRDGGEKRGEAKPEEMIHIFEIKLNELRRSIRRYASREAASTTVAQGVSPGSELIAAKSPERATYSAAPSGAVRSTVRLPDAMGYLLSPLRGETIHSHFL